MKPEFSVLIGGNKSPSGQSVKNHIFVSGFATDTRLMGVVGIELTWKVSSSPRQPADMGEHPDTEYPDVPETFRQIFYLDCESRYIDTYYECYGDDDFALRRERIRLVAALGGNLVPLTEKEARFLIQSYSGLAGGSSRLPEGGSSYPFLLFPEQTLTQEEYDALASKICSSVSTPNFAVNYFLMRSVSADERGCAYMRGNVRFQDPEHIRPADMPLRAHAPLFTESATLCMNKITHSHEDPDLYQSESLTERTESGYFITNCALRISDRPLRIKHAEIISEFHITDIEAAMILKRSEFISICELSDPDRYFHSAFAAFTSPFTETPYDSGRMYIKYRHHNGHAGNSVYRLNDDVEAAYFLTENNQIIIMGYTSEEASLAEFNLIAALLHCDIYTANRYEFPEPVLYEFANSGFEDFNDFLDYITDGSEE